MTTVENAYINRPSLKKKLISELAKPTVKSISYSQYSKYFKCPKAWALNYIDKVKEPSESIDLVFGQAMHSVIQEWLKTMYNVSVKQSNEMDLSSMLFQEMHKEYKLRKEKMNGTHFSTPEELTAYYMDGIEILNYLKKKRTLYFTTKKVELVAIELPMSMQLHEDYPGIRLGGNIDLIFYNEVSETYTLMDIKTSAKGWGDYKKKDVLTTVQLLIYKKFLASILNIDPSKIDVVFLILKRKLNEDSLWPQKRIQEFSPSSGKVSLNRLSKNINKFIEECFNYDGTYKVDKTYPAIAGPKYTNCTFCVYDSREDLCPKANRICSYYE